LARGSESNVGSEPLLLFACDLSSEWAGAARRAGRASKSESSQRLVTAGMLSNR
jgi:hypothetical protein